ncbi:MFS transporter [Sandarakinorhabdus sp.]|uniref:MFS transporter n=1 Tax=Sandarakinorhabdus sp. TaxID=1916663 RepID=UPI0028A605DF|nr:MFS transporter [Sandarakinorhabdus sp.]
MNDDSPAAPNRQFDIAAQIDAAAWSGWQKAVILLVASAIILDGFDNQVLGFVVPVLIREWGTTRAALAPVFALGYIGMVIGAAGGGLIGDRIGRRPALIFSVLLFGAATGLTVFAADVPQLATLRAIAGLGLGAAMPNAATLLAEFAPRRRRSLAVTLGIVCIPLGGVGGGVIAAALLPDHGWRSLFLIGGILPVLVALVLWWALPESPQFLAGKPARRAELITILQRIGLHVGDGANLQFTASPAPAGTGVGGLFAAPIRNDTSLLWIAFFACLLTTYMVFSWAPTLLSDAGLSLSLASLGVATFNIGGVLGAIAAALLIPVFGSRVVMLAMAAGGVLVAIGLAAANAAIPTTALLMLLAIEGGFINAVQTSLYGLASHIYLASQRATGVGTASGFGRNGAIVSSFVGAAVLAAGWSAYFLTLAAGMGVVMLALALIARHAPPEHRG